MIGDMKAAANYAKFLKEMKKRGIKIEDIPEHLAQGALALHQNALAVEASMSELRARANGLCRMAKHTGRSEDHAAALIAHRAYGEALCQWMSARGLGYSKTLEEHGNCEYYHLERMK